MLGTVFGIFQGHNPIFQKSAYASVKSLTYKGLIYTAGLQNRAFNSKYEYGFFPDPGRQTASLGWAPCNCGRCV